MMSVRSNISVLKSVGHIQKSTKSLTNSLNQVSTGRRINSGGDDAAGLSVATRFEADRTSLDQATRNTNDALSLLHTAEGSLETLTNIAMRFRELSVQAVNETYTSDDRTQILTEMTTLNLDWRRVAIEAEYNDISVLSSNDTISFQVGKDGSTADTISLDLSTLRISGIASFGVAGGTAAAGTAANSSVAAGNIALLDTAIDSLSRMRASVGSLQNRLETTLAENSTHNLNMQAAQGRILDADYASQTTDMTRSQMRLQAGIASLSQAKSMPQGVLGLLN